MGGKRVRNDEATFIAPVTEYDWIEHICTSARRLGNQMAHDIPALYDMQGFLHRMPTCCRHPGKSPDLVLVEDREVVCVRCAIASRRAAQSEG